MLVDFMIYVRRIVLGFFFAVFFLLLWGLTLSSLFFSIWWMATLLSYLDQSEAPLLSLILVVASLLLAGVSLYPPITTAGFTNWSTSTQTKKKIAISIFMEILWMCLVGYIFLLILVSSGD